MFIETKRVATTGLAIAGLLSLSACGGGGDSGLGNPVSSPTTVSGVVAKGLVKQAKVLVCRIVNGEPEADASCAATTSGSDGSFTAVMRDGFKGAAIVKVMAGANSLMLDETTGSDIPYNMTMRALVPAVSAGNPVYVTPFSEMASKAVGTTAIDPDKIRLAMTTVQTMTAGLGVDLSVMPMVDIKNNGADATMMGKQANMVAQLTRVMMAAKNSDLLKDGNGVSCNAPGTSATQQVTCAVSMMAGLMTGPTTMDQTKAAAVISALAAQIPATAYMPIIMANGTLVIQAADMTSIGSMQTAMQSAGMSSATVTGTVGTMMMGMH